jgi:hypothetical protein
MEGVQGFTRSHWTPTLGEYLHHIAPVATMLTVSKTMMTKYTNFAGHFVGCGGAPVQYYSHRSMEGVQGFNGSH